MDKTAICRGLRELQSNAGDYTQVVPLSQYDDFTNAMADIVIAAFVLAASAGADLPCAIIEKLANGTNGTPTADI